MHIAVIGKGGSGKTNLTARLAQMAALLDPDHPVVTIDADINQRLLYQFGDPASITTPELGNDLPALKQILRGTNPLIPDAAKMIKTALPGPGSHIIDVSPEDPVLKRYAHRIDNIFHLRVGGMQPDDLATHCFHSKTGAAELVMNHMRGAARDKVFVDMTAGADAFASGLFSRFDLTLAAVEPTQDSVEAFLQYQRYAEDSGFPVTLKVIGNKVRDAADRDFILQHCGQDAVLGFMSDSEWIRAREKGSILPFETFLEREPENAAAIKSVLEYAQGLERDWDKFWREGAQIHNRNALQWANKAIGEDVRGQVNLEYTRQIRPDKPLPPVPEWLARGLPKPALAEGARAHGWLPKQKTAFAIATVSICAGAAYVLSRLKSRKEQEDVPMPTTTTAPQR